MRSSRWKCTLLVLAGLSVGTLLFLSNWKKGNPQVIVPASSYSFHADRQNAVSVNDIVVSLYPSDPVVKEGVAFQVTCTAAGAEQVYFVLPKLDFFLLSTVKTKSYDGGALLTFTKVEIGHQEKYICSAQDTVGRKKKSVFELKVVKRDEDEVFIAREGGVGGDDRREVEWEVGDGEGGRMNGVGGDDGIREGEKWEVGDGVKVGVDDRRGVANGDSDVWEGGVISDNDRAGVLRGEDGEGVEEGENAGRVIDDDNEEDPFFETMEERSQFQRQQVDEFCTRHNRDDIKFRVPIPGQDQYGKDNTLFSFNRHMLLDNRRQVLFCFVPKTGCTNLKLLMFYNQGYIPSFVLNRSPDQINQNNLEVIMGRNSFREMKATTEQKESMLKSYYKFIMVRNPLERVVSSYRDKVERFPCLGLDDQRPSFNWLRKAIFSTLRPNEYAAWVEDKGRSPVNISFVEFVEYWTYHPIFSSFDGTLDEHFRTTTELCQPCRVRFDFYGNFKHFDRDAAVFIDIIGASSSYLRQSYYSKETSTEQRMKLYYSTISEKLKIGMLKKLALELEFYYSIFPEERDIHKTILGVDIDIPLS